MTTHEDQHAGSNAEIGYGAAEVDVDENTPAQAQPDRPEHDASDPRADGFAARGRTEIESARGQAANA